MVMPTQGHHTIPVVIDRDFSPEMKQEVKNAIKEWNLSLNGNISLFVISEDFNMEVSMIETIIQTHGIMILSVSPEGVVFRNIDDGNLGAKVDAIGGTTVYLLQGRATVERAKRLTMHEIGHILGAQHRDGTLMDPSLRHATPCIDQETIEQVAQYQNLNAKTMNYCRQE